VDETLTVDPSDLRFVFQGMWDKHKSGKEYGQFQWRIGILTPATSPEFVPHNEPGNHQIERGKPLGNSTLLLIRFEEA
jgi:hypothetical protein